MKRLLECIIAVGFIVYITFTGYATAQDRQRQSIDFDWKFLLGDVANAEQPTFNDSEWRALDLPHDWSIEGEYDQNAPTGGSGGYLPTGIGWYRKHLSLPADVRGKTVLIQFDGVYMNSDVWINGHHLGNYPYGYNSFYYDVSPYVMQGDNVISVRADNSQQPNTRWYSGSGIYRHVWLVITDPLHVGQWGTYITTPEVSESSANVIIETTIDNDSDTSKKCSLVTTIIGPNGSQAGKVNTTAEIPAHSSRTVTGTVRVSQPELWSLDTPSLYTALSEVNDGNRTVDAYETTFGIRSIEYDTDKGFLLNGEQVKMNGVNVHHEAGGVGAAVPERVWERRLEILKQMGCNAIRTAHNPPAPEFLDMCDRMGFLVMDEIFDEWQIGKVNFGYHLYFDEWSDRDLTTMIHRDRNHPSVVLWSVGNEIREQTRENGHEILQRLVNICHTEDPTRPVTVGCDNIAADNASTTLEFLESLDIVGYNYVDRWHERRELYFSLDHYAHPDWKMIGTESTSPNGNRGEYSFGNDPNVARMQIPRSLVQVQEQWKFVRMNDYVIGDFMWTGFDYLGETRWPSRLSPGGALDLCGFPKDAFYFYQSQWTDDPMIYLLPHWNWSGHEGQIIPVSCFTNCDTVELFLNGKSFGVKRVEFPRQGTSGGWSRYENPQIIPTTSDLFMTWDVPFEPGVLKAVGSIYGEVVFTKEIQTSGDPAAIRLSVDRSVITADRRDVAHVTVEILDAQGNIVPTADNLVNFSISGAGNLIGVENGNPRDLSSYQVSERHAYNGLCLAIVQSTDTPGSIRFEATADGLKGAVVEFTSARE